MTDPRIVFTVIAFTLASFLLWALLRIAAFKTPKPPRIRAGSTESPCVWCGQGTNGHDPKTKRCIDFERSGL